jgi:hypothetical protein
MVKVIVLVGLATAVMQPDIALFADGETSFGGLKSLLRLEQLQSITHSAWRMDPTKKIDCS